MKLPWIIAIAALGTAVYVLVNAPQQQSAGADPDVDKAASKTGTWGTKQRVKGTGGDLLGQAKEGIGNVTGDKQMQGEGVVDQVVGTVKDAAGQAAHAVSDTLHESNSQTM